MVQRKIKAIGSIGIIALSASRLFATDLHVPSEYATIQEAVDAAGYNDTIVIAEGIYTPGNVDLGFMSLSIEGTTLEGEPATILDGNNAGRLFTISEGTANQVISNIHFMNGHSGQGGAVKIEEPDGITINNCIFENNNATTKGGAVYTAGTNVDLSAVTILDCTFLYNTSPLGGAVYSRTILSTSQGHAEVTFENCEFQGNAASDSGGAVYLYRKVKGIFKDSSLIANEASVNGGAIATKQYADLETLRCIVSSNLAGSDGGGVYVDDSDGETIEVLESSYVGNTAGVGGALQEVNGLFYIRNGSFCGNTPDNFGSSDTTQENVCIEDDCTDSDGDYWIDLCEECDNDPDKLAPGNCGCGVPDTDVDTDGDGVFDCIDGCPDDPVKTEPGLCGCGTPDDANGDGWIDCDTTDNGDGTTTWHVDVETSLPLALSLALAGDTITLDEGTHFAANLNPSGLDIIVSGAVDANGDPASIIDASQVSRVFTIETNESSALHFENIVFTNGMLGSDNGGGVLIDGASPTFVNCWFNNNQTNQSGGGVYVMSDGSPTFTDCKFIGNTCTWGGGLYLNSSSAELTRCIVSGNQTTGNAGGVTVKNSTAVLTDCEVTDNVSNGTGGGMRANNGSTITLYSTAIHDNTGSNGGGIFIDAGNATISATGSTLCGNIPQNIAGGGWDDLGGSCEAENCDDTDENGIPDECESGCEADLNSDGSVNIHDILLMVGAWNEESGDITGDGTTNIHDLLLLLAEFGQSCDL